MFTPVYITGGEICLSTKIYISHNQDKRLILISAKTQNSCLWQCFLSWRIFPSVRTGIVYYNWRLEVFHSCREIYLVNWDAKRYRQRISWNDYRYTLSRFFWKRSIFLKQTKPFCHKTINPKKKKNKKFYQNCSVATWSSRITTWVYVATKNPNLLLNR